MSETQYSPPPCGSLVECYLSPVAVVLGAMSDESAPRAVTRLLHASAAGDQEAFGKVFPIVYAELRRIARRQLRGSYDQRTIDTTGLVHELYLKMVGSPQTAWENRAHFFAISARAMRQILVDLARRRQAEKRGSGERAVTLNTGHGTDQESVPRVIAIGEARKNLAEIDESLVQLVELKFFAGLTQTEIAEVLGITDRTVRRRWIRAKAWIQEGMKQE